MTGQNTANALDAALRQALDMDVPVNQRLEIYAVALRRHLVPFAEAVDRLVERLEHVGAGSGAPKVGETMPPFLLPDHTGCLVGLDDLLTDGPVAIAFHRGHWCPYCQINARALAQVQHRVRTRGGQLVAITPERQQFMQQHRSAAQAEYRMLSDVDNGYALSLNLAIWVGEELKRVMSDFGRDLETYQGNPSWFLPIPATFVVSRSGVITARFVDPDYRRRMEVEELVAALEAAH